MSKQLSQLDTCAYNEFISKGICAANPTLSALQEAILLYIEELAHYLLQLKCFGAHNEVIKEHIILGISGIISNVDYNMDEFRNLIFMLAEDLHQSKLIYTKLCKENKVTPKFLKTPLKHSKITNFQNIIKRSEKHYIQRNTDYSPDERNLFDIMLALTKNICTKIIQIKSYNKEYETAYHAILCLCKAMGWEHLNFDKIKHTIEECILEYHSLINRLAEAQEEAHGERKSVYIPFSPRNGKAILVSGIDMTQLEAILQSVKDRPIDVYTHGNTMLMAHTLSKFREYKNLVGHFGQGTENSLFDFAAFPGAILTTKYLFQKVEYLYKGRLFTTDHFSEKGIIKIKDNDFEPLIQSALTAKGFTKAQQEHILRVGFRQKEMEKKVQDVISKMKSGKIKHLFIIGLLNNGTEYEDYFNEFLSIMPKDCYALSLSYNINEENILHIDSFYDYLFIFRVLSQINKEKTLKELDITIFITKCDQYTISNIINFKNMGIKNIFLCDCIPTLINPTLYRTLAQIFGIKKFSDAKEDLENILQKKEIEGQYE